MPLICYSTHFHALLGFIGQQCNVKSDVLSIDLSQCTCLWKPVSFTVFMFYLFILVFVLAGVNVSL